MSQVLSKRETQWLIFQLYEVTPGPERRGVSKPAIIHNLTLRAGQKLDQGFSSRLEGLG
jgi:hypothetical protein